MRIVLAFLSLPVLISTEHYFCDALSVPFARDSAIDHPYGAYPNAQGNQGNALRIHMLGQTAGSQALVRQS
ncbi:hypothetical protein GCM10027563_08900 [Parasphingorhabdus pacifica]